MTFVPVEDRTFIVGTFCFVFFVFDLFGPAHGNVRVETVPFFLVEGSE